ncbi:AfsR/SARP family transcriptional regulator [Streptomyces sp. DSM 15324]|uniref:AfsR/SARP family transcriptional regulator n=1 Tax=Streptomyces sp. DSM 15324 TaxID=1739111 RepID=UPI002278369B|nr:BTAD domain-containing putative transcriptional regulator [Streptomyces sp. DSM 15324]
MFVRQYEVDRVGAQRSETAHTRGDGSVVLVQLLGPVEYRAVGESPVELGQARQRGIFAMLAMSANEVVMPDELIDRAWGAEPPQSARNMIHSYISRLRGALENGGGGAGATLRRRNGGYTLEVDPDSVDLRRFRRIVAAARGAADTRTAVQLFREALDAWQGRALGGIKGEWAERTRRLLERERVSALVACHEAELRLGNHLGLLDELHSLADQHADNELVIRNLMTALHRSGRRAEAVEAFDALRRRLADRLGVDPAPQTRELHARILRGDTEVVSVPAAADVSPTVPRQLPRGTRCVGREQELAMLDGFVTADDGRPSTRVIEGPPGIGKTALAVQWAHRVAHRFPDGQIFVALHGSGGEGRQGRAWPTARTAVALRQDGPPAVRVPVPRAAPARERAPSADDVLRFVLRSLGVTVPRTESDPVGFGQRVLRELKLLVVLDDLASADQLAALLPGPSAGALLVTTRDDGRLDGLDGLRAVRLRELSAQQARRMLAGILGERRVAAEPEAVARIIELCRRTPRALSEAAEHALVRPCLPLADLAEAMAAGAVGAG